MLMKNVSNVFFKRTMNHRANKITPEGSRLRADVEIWIEWEIIYIILNVTFVQNGRHFWYSSYLDYVILPLE